MTKQDPQEVWDEYYERKKRQRLQEASELNKQMQKVGITDETVLVIDFTHFGSSKEKVDNLANQLSEHYTMDVTFYEQEEYWFAKGTTKPYGISFCNEEHIAWAEFMCDVARSYNCVFSTWSIHSPDLDTTIESENIEV